jgi:tetratricopeptide (TPR) repeat protein
VKGRPPKGCPFFLSYNHFMSKGLRTILALPALIVLAVGIYYIPPVHDRLSWRLDDLRTLVIYYFKPPDQAVFRPAQLQQAAIDAIVSATMQAHAAAQPSTPAPTSLPGPTATPTATPQPLPAAVSIPGVKYENQFNRWNYCGPANFSMALTFWGWKGNRDDIGKAVKPSDKDKNVMPYEFQDYIAGNVSGITSLLRYGGDIEVIQRLLAGGFPVIAEKGEYQYDTTGRIGWMGHYQFITGYDNTSQTLLIQDTYLDGPNFRMTYDKFLEGWRSFNYVFVVVYPVDRESDVMSLLGQYADAKWATQHALDISTAESASLTGTQQFFAWFNIGTSHVERLEYVDAASSYDKAFQIYATLDPGYSTRPFRMMWYQTGAYKAYFYAQRYQDVISLANNTLNTVSEPVLEESLYWRGRAEAATGSIQAAINDYRSALVVHPKYSPALLGLQDLGVGP